MIFERKHIYILYFFAFLYYAMGWFDYIMTVAGYKITLKDASWFTDLLMSNGIPPLHLIIIPLIVIFLITYLHCYIVKKGIKKIDIGIFGSYLYDLAILVLFVVSIAHFYGGLSWFLNGWL